MFQTRQLEKENRIEIEVENTKNLLANLSTEEIEKLRKETEERLETFKKFREHDKAIAHVDLDCFYVQAETLLRYDLDPEAPIAVGCDTMLSTANYQARTFGVRSAMPGLQAKKLCPGLIILPVDFSKYSMLSTLFHEVIERQSEKCRHIGYDEAYIDLTEKLKDFKKPGKIHFQTFGGKCYCLLPLHRNLPKNIEVTELKADTYNCESCKKQQIKHYMEAIIPPNFDGLLQKIRLEVYISTGLTCSIGGAPTYSLSKVCSDVNKPNNQFIVDKENFDTFCLDLKLSDFSGIGPTVSQKLQSLKLITFKDALNNLSLLAITFKNGGFDNLLSILAGLDFVPDIGNLKNNPSGYPPYDDSEDFTRGREETFNPTNNVEELEEILRRVTGEACAIASESASCTNGIYLKIKFANFSVKTVSRRVPDLPLKNVDHLFKIVKQLFENLIVMPIRLLGVRFALCTSAKENKKQARIEFNKVGVNEIFNALRNSHPKTSTDTPGSSANIINDTTKEIKQIIPSPARTPKKKPHHKVDKKKKNLKSPLSEGSIVRHLIKKPKLDEDIIVINHDSDIELC